jgi:hypothetical protein
MALENKPICSPFPYGASRARTGDLLLAKRARVAAVYCGLSPIVRILT